MKKSLLLALGIMMIIGCSHSQEYLDNPVSFIKDPHFSDYKDSRDDLESSYLRKEITYAEYMEQKGEVDNQYSREVQERDQIISSGR